MQCPRCQHGNREGRRYCAECGALLAVACPSCAFSNEPGEKFCGGCGAPLGASAGAAPDSRFNSPESYTPKHLAEKILTSKAALEGERKQVTVLFSDLKGSMELLADRDPEEARKILDPVLEHMMEAVHRYEGTVNQVMGDGIMALFGAPLAHEDHAVRACYAALRMQESVKRYAEEIFRTYGVPVRIRVGLNSGEVVVRSIGSDLHMDYSAVGQTTHLAARMEQLADPGAILLTPDTLHLAEGFVQVRSLGVVAVKGLATPAEIFELTGASPVRSRLQAAAARGLTTFVGRDAEMEELSRALEQAQGGHGRLVAVVGEPGVGKSRLFHELIHSHRTHGWRVLESASMSHGNATAYLPVIDLLRNYVGIESSDDARAVRAKVTGTMLTLDSTLHDAVSPVLALLDALPPDDQFLKLDPPHRRQLTIIAVKRLILRESKVQPLLLIFEDLHWIDAEAQAVLDSLVDDLPSASMLLAVNYRPEYRHGWASKTYYCQLRIDALPAESADKLLSALAGDDPSLQPLKRLLIDRTEGNPFFLEESIRSLVETGVLIGEPGAFRIELPLPKIRVPASVHAVLAARIDRLPPEDKQLLQGAAVVGKDVGLNLLEAVAGLTPNQLAGGLARLQAAEFLDETGLFLDPEYAFKHALTHEVAYRSLLTDRRRALHAQLAAAIEHLYRDRLTEHVERLAHHALRGELWGKAVDYLRQASERALARSANVEAASSLEQALEALKHLPSARATTEQAIDLRLALRAALSGLGQSERAASRLLEAEILARELDDRRRLGWVSVALCLVLSLVDRDDEARRFGDSALRLGRALADRALEAVAKVNLAAVCFITADPATCVRLARDATELLQGDLRLTRLDQAIIPSVVARHWLARGLAQLGNFEEGIRYGCAAIEIAESLGHPTSTAGAWVALGHLYSERGDFDRARPLLERALALCRDLGFRLYLGVARLNLGEVHARTGSVGEALSLLEEAQEAFRASGRSFDGLIALAVAEAHLHAGHLEEARASAERALAWARERAERGWEPLARYILGSVATRVFPLEIAVAEQHLEGALVTASEYGRRPLIAHCHLGLGKLYRRTGKADQAREHLTTATTMYREMDMRFWLEQAEAELHNLA
jgi:class 3 adenylate cyclase/tetratricopeptide (TPR) repeat protein